MTPPAAQDAIADRPRVDDVPFNDLSFQWRQIRGGTLPDMLRLFDESAFCLGPFVDEFEQAVAKYLGVEHAIGVNSGTSALHLALIAAGIGAGDKVLVPSFTFIATAAAALYVGAIPVLCDIDADSATIDVEDAERRIDSRVKAIIPVHLYGQPASMDRIASLAVRYRLTVIEDAAQAIGARYGPRSVGTIGQFGCFSFYPGKNLGAAGEGGIVVTADAAAARRIRSLRHHGQQKQYLHHEIGFNYRMEGLQGLVLRRKLALLDGWTETRRSFARAYQDRLSGLPLTLPRIVNHDHVFHLYVVCTPQRDRLRDYLAQRGIDTRLHYPVPLHRQPCLANLVDHPASYPAAERYAKECLSLPLFIGMTEAQLDRVCDCIRRFFGSNATHASRP